MKTIESELLPNYFSHIWILSWFGWLSSWFQ